MSVFLIVGETADLLSNPGCAVFSLKLAGADFDKIDQPANSEDAAGAQPDDAGPDLARHETMNSQTA